MPKQQQAQQQQGRRRKPLRPLTASEMAKRRAALMTAEQRSEHGRRMVQARWRRWRRLQRQKARAARDAKGKVKEA